METVFFGSGMSCLACSLLTVHALSSATVCLPICRGVPADSCMTSLSCAVSSSHMPLPMYLLVHPSLLMHAFVASFDSVNARQQGHQHEHGELSNTARDSIITYK